MFKNFFSDCRYMPWLQRYSPTKLCDGAQMDTMCGCMADIQSAMAENR